jgi:hypothetical protein
MKMHAAALCCTLNVPHVNVQRLLQVNQVRAAPVYTQG